MRIIHTPNGERDDSQKELSDSFADDFESVLLAYEPNFRGIESYLSKRDPKSKISKHVRRYLADLFEEKGELRDPFAAIATYVRKHRSDEMTTNDIDDQRLIQDPNLRKLLQLPRASRRGGRAHIREISDALIHATVSLPFVIELEENPSDLNDLSAEAYNKVKPGPDIVDHNARYITQVIREKLTSLEEDDNEKLLTA